jgi:Asp-tRNA(Asn)/Glu-tRNA(Gln) amidotransferase B subunit
MNPELAEQLVQDKKLADLFEQIMKEYPDLDPDHAAEWVIKIKQEAMYRKLKI